MRVSRWTALLGYFSLLSITLVWNAWLAPSSHIPRSLVLLVLLIPLLLPLRGLLHGNPYTYAWTSFIALFYFMLGISNAAGDQQPIYAALQILASLSLFWGCVFYTRSKGRQT